MSRHETEEYRFAMGALRTWARGHVLAVDSIIALAFFALGLLSIRSYYDIGTAAPHNFRFATAVGFTALLTLPLALRRQVPPLPLVCVTIAITGYTVWGVSEAVSSSAAFVAIYSTGAYSPPRVANWVRGVCIGVMSADLSWILLFRQIDINHSKASILGAALLSVGNNLFFFATAWVIGDVARTSRLRAVKLAERNAELQTAHEMIAEQAVLDERVRIAREVHDVVAHHVSVMGVQAGAARRVMDRSPDLAAEALTSIEASSRQAVAELHRLLGFLRAGTEDTREGTAPQPNLAGLAGLIAEVNEAGLMASAEVEGTPRPLPASVDVSAYRIAQEGLTNALKHGGAGTIVKVTVRYTPDSLEVFVVDDGRGRSNGRTGEIPIRTLPSGGHGLVGMRERVALHGGHLEAGPRPGSGFAVQATFPLIAGFRVAS
jgi:signal transduction histidine kinase